MTDGADWGEVPESWVVWSAADEGRVVLVFRPDVFDGAAHPAECLPTLYVSQRPPGQPMRRPGSGSAEWSVSLTLEPTVRVRSEEATFDARADAVAGAVDLAARFAAGEVDYRGAYQVPRDAYLDELDDLTG